MLVQYKRNGHPAYYDPMWLSSAEKAADERLIGPFESCGNCTYASHGFLCYTAEGDCLRTDLRKRNERKDENTNG